MGDMGKASHNSLGDSYFRLPLSNPTSGEVLGDRGRKRGTGEDREGTG